jgi:hypothetical protein
MGCAHEFFRVNALLQCVLARSLVTKWEGIRVVAHICICMYTHSHAATSGIQLNSAGEWSTI